MSLREDADRLVRFTEYNLRLLERRISELSRREDLLNLIRALDVEAARRAAEEFFGDGTFRYVGIDGSMALEERLEMLLVYANAAGYEGEFSVRGGEIEADLERCELSAKLSAAANVPLWLEDAHLVARARGASDYEITKSLESIAFALMTFSEFWLARRAVLGGYKVVVLDRMISGSFSPLHRDFRRLIELASPEGSGLVGFDTGRGPLTLADLYLAGNLGPPELGPPPARPPYITHAALYRLIQEGEATLEELAEELRYDASKLRRLLETANGRCGGELLDISGSLVKVAPTAEGYWERALAAAERFAKALYEGSEYPFEVGGRWLRTFEVNVLTLFALLDAVVKARRARALLVGVVKDTSVTDVTRAVASAAASLGMLKEQTPISVRNDKAMLTLLSAIFAEKLPTPWRTLEYDASLSTVRSFSREGDTVVAKAARRFLLREGLFARAFFQLRSMPSDPAARSPVFIYDRPLYPRELDDRLEARFRRDDGKVDYPYRPALEPLGGELGNLTLYVLSKLERGEAFEEMGHVHPLFLADKYVKALAYSARGMLRGVAELKIMPAARRYRAYFIARRFRDIRREIERLRERG